MEERKREKFPFYASFKDAINDLPSDAEKLQIYEAITNYSFFGKEPEDLNGMGLFCWKLIKPFLDRSFSLYEHCKQNGQKGAEHGKKGGRPRKEKPQEKPQYMNLEYMNLESAHNTRTSEEKKEWELFLDGKRSEIYAFGRIEGIPKSKIDDFWEMTEFNWSLYADAKGANNLYTKNGAVIRNWKGALIKFAKVDYDEWKEEHGYKRNYKTGRKR